MRLYIANATKQTHDFIYRLPESSNTHKQQIDIGGQICLPGDLSKVDIDAVLEQHRPYGLVASDEIDRAKFFSGLCYSVDKPVSLPSIQKLFVVNDRALEEKGRQIREAAAVAVAGQLEDNLTGETNLKQIEMSVVEEQPGATRSGIDNDTARPVAEGVRVTKDTNRAPPPKNARRRRA